MAKKAAQKMHTFSVPALVLGIDANSDPDAQAMGAYRDVHVYPYFEKKGFTVARCQGPLAVRSHISSEAPKAGVVYITGSGHGDAYTLKGHLYDPVFRSNEYSSAEVTGRIIHFHACSTARNLGGNLVANGCQAFFGYQAAFLWPPDPPLAAFFFECDSEIDRAFADGLDAAAAYKHVADLFKTRAADLRALGKQDEAGVLEEDFEALCCPSFPTPNGFGSEAAHLPL